MIISLILILILFFSLLSPDICWSIHKASFKEAHFSTYGYKTPKQFRYSKGDSVTLISDNSSWTIVENARYDYLIQNDNDGTWKIVLQTEILAQ